MGSGGGGVEPMTIGPAVPEANRHYGGGGKKETISCGGGSFNFKMPLHYPRYTKDDYETMPEWKLDRLLAQYGLPATGDLPQKRSFAMGAFLWEPCSLING